MRPGGGCSCDGSHCLRRRRECRSRCRHRDRKNDTLDQIEVVGVWVPKKGWAANVQYDSKKNEIDFANLRLVQQAGNPFRFGGDQSVNWPSIVEVDFETNSFSYRYKRGGRRSKENPSEFLANLDFPESFRELLLNNIKQLKQIATEDINQSKGVKTFDTSNVRSDSPPIQTPTESIGNNVKAKLLEKVTAKLDEQEKLILENWQEMYEAIRKALPIDPAKLIVTK